MSDINNWVCLSIGWEYRWRFFFFYVINWMMAGEENIDSSKNICYHFDRNKTENINGICNFIIMDFHCHQQLERHLVHTTMWLCDTIVVNYLLVWKFISTWLYDWSLSILDCDATIYGSISELLTESTASHSRPYMSISRVIIRYTCCEMHAATESSVCDQYTQTIQRKHLPVPVFFSLHLNH